MVQTLLTAGVPGSRVVLVQPPLQVPTCFNNPFVEDAVTAALKESGKSFFFVTRSKFCCYKNHRWLHRNNVSCNLFRSR